MLTSLPREIVRVKRNAVAADARSWKERHKTKRFCCGRTNDLPGVDAESIADLGHLVRHANIDRSKCVFPQLASLSNPSRRDRVYFVYDLTIKQRGNLCRIFGNAANNLWNVVCLKLRIARIDSFR